MTLAGELDLATAPRLRTVLLSILERQAEPASRWSPEALVVDLSGLELLSAAGLSVLYEAHQRAGQAGLRLRIVTGSRPSMSGLVLRLTGLESVLDVYPSLLAAQEPMPPIGEL
ncbi:MAG TPA: STAS domain-containing protein [Pseudonocardiaceae bacterium]|nr:STAS domain-containing protein [Pseudonocardiaceae bacterium]